MSQGVTLADLQAAQLKLDEIGPIATHVWAHPDVVALLKVRILQVPSLATSALDLQIEEDATMPLRVVLFGQYELCNGEGTTGWHKHRKILKTVYL